MGGRAGFERARGGWCNVGKLTADFWGIRLVRACLRDIWASVCSREQAANTIRQGVDHWAGVPMAVVVENDQLGHLLSWALGAPYLPAAPV